MAQRGRTLLGVAVWTAFLLVLLLRITAGNELVDVAAQLKAAGGGPRAEVALSEAEIAALEEQLATQEGMLSLVTFGLFALGLAGLYFVNRGLASRVGFALATVVLVTLVTFTLLRLMPGDPFQNMANELVIDRGMDFSDALQMAYRMLDYDPDKPFLAGFLEYSGSVLRFDLGESWQYKVPVNEVISRALPWTLLVLASSLILSFAIGAGMGMVIAWKRRTALDPLVTFYAAFTGATPDYVTALVLLIIFAVNLHWFPITGGYDAALEAGFNWPFIASVIFHGFLPILAYTFENTAAWALAMKGSAVSVLGEDYITVARVRGLKDRRIMTSYVGRNAMLPMITTLAITLGTMLAGSTLIENIFNYPGIGRFFAEALTRRDLGMMQGLFLFQAAAVIVANLFADVLYSRLDPRIKLED